MQPIHNFVFKNEMDTGSELKLTSRTSILLYLFLFLSNGLAGSTILMALVFPLFTAQTSNLPSHTPVLKEETWLKITLPLLVFLAWSSESVHERSNSYKVLSDKTKIFEYSTNTSICVTYGLLITIVGSEQILSLEVALMDLTVDTHTPPSVPYSNFFPP